MIVFPSGLRIHEVDFVPLKERFQPGGVRIRLEDDSWLSFTSGENGDKVEVEDWPEGRIYADHMTEYRVIVKERDGDYVAVAEFDPVLVLAETRRDGEAMALKKLGLSSRPPKSSLGSYECKVERNCKSDPIVIELAKPDPEKSHYMKTVGRRTIQEVATDLCEALGEMVDEYFCIAPDIKHGSRTHNLRPSSPFPDYHWIECSAVTGGSEGHYVHARAFMQNDENVMLYMIKSFRGLAHCYCIAEKCARLLGA
jgi:hypothetical protein